METKYQNQLRHRSIWHVTRELKEVRERGIRKVLFYENELNSGDDERIYNICEIMQRLGLKWECFLRANGIHSELIRKMRQSGCEMVRFGVETGCDELLRRSMNKDLRRKDIEEAFSICRKEGMPTISHLCLGTPFEDKNTFEETKNFVKGLKTTPMMSYFRPFPGTPMAKYVKREGLEENDYWHWVEKGDCTGNHPFCATHHLTIPELVREYEKLRVALTKKSIIHRIQEKMR